MGLLVSKLLFQPPKPASYSVEDVEKRYPHLAPLLRLRTKRGNVIAGIFIHAPPKSTEEPWTIIFSHGNAEDLGHLIPWLCVLSTRLRANVLSYDYSGYGCSTGKPSEKNCYADIEAVFDYAVNGLGIDPQQIVFYGKSVGGGPSAWIASHLATQHRLAALILQSTFTSVFRVGHDRVGRALPGDPFPNIFRVQMVKCPVLVVHGIEDEVVPYSHAQDLAQSCPSSMLVPIPRADHNNLCDEYMDDLLIALKTFLSGLKSMSTYHHQQMTEPLHSLDVLTGFSTDDTPESPLAYTVQTRDAHRFRSFRHIPTPTKLDPMLAEMSARDAILAQTDPEMRGSASRGESGRGAEEEEEDFEVLTKAIDRVAVEVHRTTVSSHPSDRRSVEAPPSSSFYGFAGGKSALQRGQSTLTASSWSNDMDSPAPIRFGAACVHSLSNSPSPRTSVLGSATSQATTIDTAESVDIRSDSHSDLLSHRRDSHADLSDHRRDPNGEVRMTTTAERRTSTTQQHSDSFVLYDAVGTLSKVRRDVPIAAARLSATTATASIVAGENSRTNESTDTNVRSDASASSAVGMSMSPSSHPLSPHTQLATPAKPPQSLSLSLSPGVEGEEDIGAFRTPLRNMVETLPRGETFHTPKDSWGDEET